MTIIVWIIAEEVREGENSLRAVNIMYKSSKNLPPEQGCAPRPLPSKASGTGPTGHKEFDPESGQMYEACAIVCKHWKTSSENANTILLNN